jgi:hypothetical protein
MPSNKMSAEKSIKELRKELKEHRASVAKAPSKMKKHEILMELERKEERVIRNLEAVVPPAVKPAVKKVEKEIAAIHKVENVLEKDKPAKKAPRKAAAPAEGALPPKPKKDLPKPDEVKPAKTASEGVKKLVKGSQEARDKMAAIRAMRNAKKNVD